MRWNSKQLADYDLKRKKTPLESKNEAQPIPNPRPDKKDVPKRLKLTQEKTPTERDEQRAVIKWLSHRKHTVARWHHSPNGWSGGKDRKRNAIHGHALKLDGTSSGFPDLIVFPKPELKLPLIFLEMKRKNGIATDVQNEWIGFINEHRFAKAACCRGWEEATRFLIEEGY